MVSALSQLKSAEIRSQINIRVAQKAMEVQRMDGAAALKLLSSASQQVATAGDAMVAAATGLGGQLDLRA